MLENPKSEYGADDQKLPHAKDAKNAKGKKRFNH
jgi:hypothetical protein